MDLIAHILIPQSGVDDFGQVAEASATFLRYSLSLQLKSGRNGSGDDIELISEDLRHIRKGDARRELGFPSSPAWREEAIKADRSRDFISTHLAAGRIRLHQDRSPRPGQKRGGGRSLEIPRAGLTRTVLSGAIHAQESRTAVLVRNAFRNCRLMQLEPSALRQPDEIYAPGRMDEKGSHLAAAIYRLAGGDLGRSEQGTRTLGALANRLNDLLDGVRDLWVDRDEKRQLLTLMLRDRFGVELPAGSLSDGTLRFLPLAVLELDPEEAGVICLEEPENGVHPQRVHAVVRLLQEIASDPCEPAGDLPLRQVLINTHSPLVVEEVGTDDLLFADLVPEAPSLARGSENGRGNSSTRGRTLTFRCLEGTWRAARPDAPLAITRGELLAYLGGHPPVTEEPDASRRRVRDRARDIRDQLRLEFEV